MEQIKNYDDLKGKQIKVAAEDPEGNIVFLLENEEFVVIEAGYEFQAMIHVGDYDLSITRENEHILDLLGMIDDQTKQRFTREWIEARRKQVEKNERHKLQRLLAKYSDEARRASYR